MIKKMLIILFLLLSFLPSFSLPLYCFLSISHHRFFILITYHNFNIFTILLLFILVHTNGKMEAQG